MCWKVASGSSCEAGTACNYAHSLQELAPKTFAKRKEERERQGLPILSKQQEFVSLLRTNKVVVVVAETGSGKTTQLPQYAAEAFTGRVVCTQPRALAAEDIAKRVADEFDGCDVGGNVGFKARRRETQGQRIMLVTDAALISMARSNPHLQEMSVLMIDEAHERSLNTDIVLGIAKRIRAARPHDFHIVVASATINPKDFVAFFGGSACVLEVKGRTYPVETEYKPGEQMIPACLDALEEHPVGNMIAFLPGQREVEDAVQKFSTQAPAHIKAFALHGGLSGEEQARVTEWDKRPHPEGERMVVFATNIAETSLTLPGVRLVVDSGLAKESRYDPQRRIELLEQVMIARSSADQRKGRSGRIAPGHCIRLYAEDDFKRQSIQPEILRSSLDHVVLRLSALEYDPLAFEFVTRPPEDSLRASIDVLTSLGCLSAGAGASSKITERGRSFVDLPFDPRLSNFVAVAGERYGREELAAQVASILTAPGSIFFMGGKAREEAKRRIARLATQHKSDLLLRVEVYKEWSAVGAPGRDGRRARVDFAAAEGLNNKVLDVVMDSVQSTIKSLRATVLRRPAGSASDEAGDIEVVGRCLLASFPEQLGQMLMPRDPSAGAFLLSNRLLRGTVSETSVLVQSSIAERSLAGEALQSSFTGCGLFLSMSPTVIPSGALMVETNHPIDSAWLDRDLAAKVQSEGLDMAMCWQRPNLGCRFQKVLIDRFADSAFVVAQWDGPQTTLRVFCPRRDAVSVAAASAEAVDGAVHDELDCERTEFICGGTAVATVESGLVVRRLERTGLQCRLRFEDLPREVRRQGDEPRPLDSHESLREFLETLVAPSEIKWVRYHPGAAGAAHRGDAVFSHEAAAQQALKAYAPLRRAGESEAGGQAADGPCAAVNIGMKDQWGRAVQWTFPDGAVTEAAAEDLARQQGSPALQVRLRHRVENSFDVVVENLPLHFDTAHLPGFAERGFAWPHGQKQTRKCKLQYGTREERDVAEGALKHVLAHTEATISLPDKFKPGETFTKRVLVKVSPETRPGKSVFGAVFASATDAEAFCHKFPDAAEGQAAAQVLHPQLFEALESTAKAVADRFGVRVYMQKTKQQAGRADTRTCSFQGGSPGKCGQAARRLTALTAPLELAVGDRLQQLLLGELHESGTLRTWEHELGLRVDVRLDRGRLRMTCHVRADAPLPSGAEVAKRLAAHVGAPAWCVAAKVDAARGKVSITFDQPRKQQERALRKAGPSELGELLGGSATRIEVAYAGLPNQLTVHGEQIKQGALMARIGERQDAFKQRYAVWSVGAGGGRLFRGALSPGAELLDRLARDAGGGASFKYNAGLGGIEAALPPSVADAPAVLAAAKLRIDDLLREYDQRGASIASCVSCGIGNGRPLRICGHQCCQACLSDEVKRGGGSSIGCPMCSTVVSVQELYDAGGALVFQDAVAKAAHDLVAASPDLEFAACPAQGCLGLLAKEDGYACCTMCGEHACGRCGTMGDELHRGLDCAQHRHRVACVGSIERLRSAAVEGFDLGALDVAIAHACSLAVDREPGGAGVLAEARARRKELLALAKRARGAERLQAAMSGSDLDALRAAIDQADAIGLGAEPQGANLLAAARASFAKLEQLRMSAQQAREWEQTGMQGLVARAIAFVEEQWDPTLPKVQETIPNGGLVRGCPAMQLFARGCGELSRGRTGGYKDVLAQSSFGWHGTSSEAGIIGICHEGFDPKRRSGQVHGPGEYFGLTPAISKGYCKSADRMIVTLILPTKCRKTVAGFCHVVNNPTDRSLSYCLPLLVVTFARLPPLQFREAPPVPIVWGDDSPAKQQRGDKAGWSTPFRWQWRQDDGAFEPYADAINAQIETAFNDFSRGGGNPRFHTPPIVRFVDDLPHRYHIDFVANTQTSELRCRRPIRRVKATAAAHGHWQWQDRDGAWRMYESLVQDVIEDAYRKYCDVVGAAVIDVRFPGRPETYRLSFVEGSQTNAVSGERRSMRRLAGALRLGPPGPPLYWKQQSGQFKKEEASQYVKEMAQALLNRTHANRRTRDRTGAMPTGFDVVEVRRIEDSAMWARYARKCHEIQARGCRGLAVRTTPELLPAVQSQLNEGANEVYLFHGTSLGSAAGIARSGFDISRAGSRKGAAYGKGAYFAESSTKSDEYARPDAEMRCAMLLCRVCLGEVCTTRDFDPAAEQRVLSSPKYDSLLGDREASVGTFREFVVYDKSQIYPEYIIDYKRRH